MAEWPKTRVTLLGRLSDPEDMNAWQEFVALYGPFIFNFARRRLPQDEDAADVMQEVLSAVHRGTYERAKGRFQKWLLTVLLNEIRDFHSARARHSEALRDVSLTAVMEDSEAEKEWEEERRRHLFHAAARLVKERSKPAHWTVFSRTALANESGQQVAQAFELSVTNVYAIKSRILKEIKEEIDRMEDEEG